MVEYGEEDLEKAKNLKGTGMLVLSGGRRRGGAGGGGDLLKQVTGGGKHNILHNATIGELQGVLLARLYQNSAVSGDQLRGCSQSRRRARGGG